MYYTPRFRNILAIHLLSAFYSDPGPKYLTSGPQQHFVPAPGACISYQAHRALCAYLSDSGMISVIAERSEYIETLITENFHPPLPIDKYLSLHTPPFNILEKMTRKPSNNQPDFLQFRRHTKFGTIFGLSLQDLYTNLSDICNRVPHFIYEKLTELGAEYLASRVLTVDAISEVNHYELNKKELTVNPNTLSY